MLYTSPRGNIKAYLKEKNYLSAFIYAIIITKSVCVFANECYQANQASSEAATPSAQPPTLHCVSTFYISSGLAKCPNLHKRLVLMRNVLSAETKLDLLDKCRPVPRRGPVVSESSAAAEPPVGALWADVQHSPKTHLICKGYGRKTCVCRSTQ